MLNFLQTRNPTPGEPTKSDYYAETRSIFTQLLEALVYLEIKEIAHGDLKPDNIILTVMNGIIIPKILDLGMATYTIPFATDETDTTLNKAVENRRRYISPEQGKVENSENLGTLGATHKSNVYSLGLMLLPMLVQFKFEFRTKSQDFISTGLNRCIQEAREVAEKRKFPEDLDCYPNEFKWIQAMLDHDYHTRPAASEIKLMLRSCPDYKSVPVPHPTSLSSLKNMNIILNSVIEDSVSTCKYEKINIDKVIAKPLTKQGAMEKCIGNDLERYTIQHLHQALDIQKADHEITVDVFRKATKMRLCSHKDLKYLLQLYLNKIEDQFSTRHELYQEFSTELEEISKHSTTCLSDMKQFITNMFETGVSMQNLIPRLKPDPGRDVLEEIMNMWSSSGFGSHVMDDTHHENRAEIETSLENLSSVSFSRDAGAHGILSNVMNQSHGPIC